MIEERIGDLTALHEPARGDASRGPLVLMHGLWGGSWIFQDWLEPAAERGWDVWAVSLRGREGSRPVEDLGKVRLQDFARDLQDALAGIGPAAVVGYSMGGLLLQMVASDAASRHLVRSAVLLCSVPPRGVVALAGPVVRRSWRYLPAMIGGRPMLPRRADADAMLLNAMPRPSATAGIRASSRTRVARPCRSRWEASPWTPRASRVRCSSSPPSTTASRRPPSSPSWSSGIGRRTFGSHRMRIS